MATILVLRVIAYSLIAIFAWIVSLFMLVYARNYGNPKPKQVVARAILFQILAFCILFSLMIEAMK